jgi:hypothetical protein
MSESEKAVDVEENPWTEEDIRKFNEKFGGDGDPDEPKIHPGASMVGFVLFLLIVYGVYQQIWGFTLYNTALLVVLALGSKSLN